MGKMRTKTAPKRRKAKAVQVFADATVFMHASWTNGVERYSAFISKVEMVKHARWEPPAPTTTRSTVRRSRAR